jgi:hypothetical protein
MQPLVGVLTPLNKRVLLRAVLRQDGSTLAIDTDAKGAVAFEVIRVAEDVTGVKVGDMCLHISAAGDLLDPDDETARHILVHEEDIVCKWPHAAAVDLTERKAAARKAAANGTEP